LGGPVQVGGPWSWSNFGFGWDLRPRSDVASGSLSRSKSLCLDDCRFRSPGRVSPPGLGLGLGFVLLLGFSVLVSPKTRHLTTGLFKTPVILIMKSRSGSMSRVS
uniref:Uncharacterized protein n=1 Tax=Cannabis sativa TaxID=3483 RepID=A0A803QRC6_CANSA